MASGMALVLGQRAVGREPHRRRHRTKPDPLIGHAPLGESCRGTTQRCARRRCSSIKRTVTDGADPVNMYSLPPGQMPVSFEFTVHDLCAPPSVVVHRIVPLPLTFLNLAVPPV